MRRLVAAFVVLATLSCAADKKRKPPKSADVAVLEVKAQRAGEQVLVDGRVRNSGEKPIDGLNLFFDFLSSDNEVVTTKRHAFEDEVLEAGQETEFRFYLVDPVRAVTFRVRAENAHGKELSISNGGPFPVY